MPKLRLNASAGIRLKEKYCFTMSVMENRAWTTDISMIVLGTTLLALLLVVFALRAGQNVARTSRSKTQ